MMLRVAENTKIPDRSRYPERQGAAALAPGRSTPSMKFARGLSVTAQIAAPPVGLLLGLELSRNPFQTIRAIARLANLPLAEP
jgi:ABC-type sulfate transport system permease component